MALVSSTPFSPLSSARRTHSTQHFAADMPAQRLGAWPPSPVSGNASPPAMSVPRRRIAATAKSLICEDKRRRDSYQLAGNVLVSANRSYSRCQGKLRGRGGGVRQMWLEVTFGPQDRARCTFRAILDFQTPHVSFWAFRASRDHPFCPSIHFVIRRSQPNRRAQRRRQARRAAKQHKN